MDQSRSNSAPLMYSNNGYSSLPRSSCSLPSLQPTKREFLTSINWNEEVEDKEEEAIRELLEDDHDSILSNSSDDEAGVAMHGRKTLNQSKPLTMNVLSSDILYEDIWTDSPIFREYLKSLELFLHRYLTWLEKVEQCRQLEIAYTKSITLLFEQTKLVLNEPFYCPTEFQHIQWPKEGVFSEDQDGVLEHILPCLRNHGAKIKEILTRFECIIKDLRTKHAQSSNAYCASQKLNMSQTNIKLLDVMK
ncbi:uncharacterized protein B0P05DRAFT_556212 [Gilbertella persicaria]|uniref:uncharacterized protein n=1 Tax=Gilbertella persicaria TaxID=101096 RepID=UPI00222108D6|nr:uncharacterized protein B0P05DRAFT_556212 [Gilbertella persicaria]KAI8062812.1 hypothetical protein B0P05DRAFT_556212 [Gilbertella persicaria]